MSLDTRTRSISSLGRSNRDNHWVTLALDIPCLLASSALEMPSRFSSSASSMAKTTGLRNTFRGFSSCNVVGSLLIIVKSGAENFERLAERGANSRFITIRFIGSSPLRGATPDLKQTTLGRFLDPYNPRMNQVHKCSSSLFFRQRNRDLTAGSSDAIRYHTKIGSTLCMFVF